MANSEFKEGRRLVAQQPSPKPIGRASWATRRRPSLGLVTALLCLITSFTFAEEAPVSFKADLAPILLNQCQSCHGPKKAKGGYRVDTFEHAIEVGFDELHYRMTTDDEDDIMPPDADRIPAEQIALFEKWQQQGQIYDAQDPTASLAEIIPRRRHPDPPKVYPRAIPITALAFRGDDGSSLLASGYHEITEWSTVDGTLKRRIKNLPERIQSIDIAPGGKRIAVAGGSPARYGEVRIVDLSDGSLVEILHKSDDLCLSAKYNPAGTQLATCGTDGTVRIYDTSTWLEVAAFANHSNWVNDVAWNADGTRIVTGSRDKTAKVFDIDTGKRISSYNAHDGSVYAVMFDNTGDHVYSASADGKLLYWRAEQAHTVRELISQEMPIYRLATADQPETVTIAGGMPSVRTIDFRDGTTQAEYTSEVGQLALAVSGDKKTIAVGDSSGLVRVFQVTSKERATQRFLALPLVKN